MLENMQKLADKAGKAKNVRADDVGHLYKKVNASGTHTTKADRIKWIIMEYL